MVAYVIWDHKARFESDIFHHTIEALESKYGGDDDAILAEIEKEVLKVKDYEVYYYTKSNKTEYINSIMIVGALNAKDACRMCKQLVKERTGKNAFRPTTKCPSEEELAWYVKHGTCRI